MKKQFWRSFTFRQLFICYFLVLLLPAVFSFGFYAYYAHVFAEKHDESQRQMIAQTANVIDERLDAVLNISDSVGVSSALLKIRYTQLPFTAEKYYRLHQAGKFLNAFSPLSSLVDYVFIYDHQMDCLLNAGHIYTESNQLPAVLEKRVGMTREAFDALMAAPRRNLFLLTNDSQNIVCVNTFDTLDKAPNLTMLLVVNTAFIQNTLADMADTSEGRAYLLDADGGVFGRADAGDWRAAAPDAGPDAQKISQGDRITLVTASRCSGFRYVLSVPLSVFTRETRTIRLIYLLCTAALLMMGAAVSYLLARRNYRPIYALGQMTDVSSTQKDELSAIQEKIQEVLTSRESMNRQICTLNKIASYQTFHALVTGDQAYMQEHANAGLNIDFKGDVFVASLIELESLAHTRPVMDLRCSGELNVLIDNILVKLCAGVCQYVIRREEELFYVILCFSPGEAENADMNALEIMEKLLRLMWRNLSLAAHIFVGDAQKGLSEVHVSCTNARRAREYFEFIGDTNKRLILYDPSMYGVTAPDENYDIMDAERRFVSQLLSGNYDQAKSILYQVLAYYRSKDGISLYIMRCRMFGLMNLMMNALHEIEPDVTADFYKECRPIERILSAKNMRELETVLFDIVEHLIGRQEHSPTDAQEKIHLIIGYVKTHYYDPNLSVQAIADEFSLSVPYLSQIFKENTKVGLLFFINQHRVNKAKEILMEDESVTLTELAQKVGYNSSQSLIRIFKRHEGTTPGSYRASITNGGDATHGPDKKEGEQAP